MKVRKPQIDAFAEAQRRNRLVSVAQNFVTDPAKDRIDPETGQVTLTDSRGNKTLLNVTDQGLEGIKTPEGRQYLIDRDEKGRIAGLRAPSDCRFGLIYDTQDLLSDVLVNEKPFIHLDYSEDDRTIEATFADGARELLQYDRAGNLVRTVDAAGGETQLRRDDAMRVVELRDPRGHSTHFDYDKEGVPVGVRFPDGTNETYSPDEQGRLKIGINGQDHAHLSFNGSDDVELIEYSDGHHVRLKQEDGKVIEASNDQHTIKFEYGDDGRLKKEFQNGSCVEYEHDPEANLVQLKTPDGLTLRYIYNGDDLLREIRDWEGKSYQFDYDASGQVSRIVFPNRVTTRVDLSQTAQDLSITTTSRAHPNEAVVDDHYTYDARGRVVGLKRTNAERQYDYDRAGRLVAVRDPQGVRESFAYDPSGNRVSCADSIAAYDAMNRLLRDGDVEFQYDASGNMTARSGQQAARYTYNGQGHLTEVTSPDKAIRYTYDAFGRRLTKQYGEVVTRFVWAGRQLLQEITTERDRVVERRDYLYLPGEHFPIAVRVDGETYCYHTDRLGTVLAMTDRAGEVVWKADYSAFGEARILVDRVSQPLRLLGQYYDAETGLHYNLCRYYDPRLGRYLTPDPIRYEAGSSNFYTFANNDPVNQSDPEGRLAFLAALGAIAVGALVGGLIGGAISAATGGSFWDGAKAGAIGGAIAVAAPVLGAALGLGAVAVGALALAGSAIAGGVEACMEEGASVGTFLKGAGIALVATVATAGLARIPGFRKLASKLAAKVGRRFKTLLSKFRKAFKKRRTKAKKGETNSTKVGKRVHKERADLRRESGKFDMVNEPFRDKSGNIIEVPRRIDTKTGLPSRRTQRAIPDAVDSRKGVIIDDKPKGRPISKDKQEINRFITAYEQSYGKPPKEIQIHRYDPATGKSAGVEVYDPKDFMIPPE